jgi:hypothetical protein
VTRCLNCGAERDADTCDACGLSSPAAEIALRRSFANRTAIFLVGALAVVVASGRYPPLELDAVLIFIGVLFFLTLGLGLWLERSATRHLEVEALKRSYFSLVPLPWLLAILLLGNGALDRRPPTGYVTHVESKFATPGPIHSRRLIVGSWRDGRRLERVAVGREDFDRFQPGDGIVVQVQGGLVGIPWVYAVYRH